MAISSLFTIFEKTSNMTKDEYDKIGREIIGAAFDVMKNSGRGMREKYYEKALIYELKRRGLNVREQVSIPALYQGVVIDDAYQADLVVNDSIIIELKATLLMGEIEVRQLITYLKLTGYKLGYLINFGAKDFVIGSSKDTYPYKNGIYRFVNNL